METCLDLLDLYQCICTFCCRFVIGSFTIIFLLHKNTKSISREQSLPENRQCAGVFVTPFVVINQPLDAYAAMRQNIGLGGLPEGIALTYLNVGLDSNSVSRYRALSVFAPPLPSITTQGLLSAPPARGF